MEIDGLFATGLDVADGDVDGLVILGYSGAEDGLPAALVGKFVLGPDRKAGVDIADGGEAVFGED